MPGFDKVSHAEIAEAAFLLGLMQGTLRQALIPLAVMVDGLPTIALCIKASPALAGMESTTILHPVAIIPHRNMLIQDLRGEVPTLIDRVPILPLDSRHARYLKAALEDPESFLSGYPS